MSSDAVRLGIPSGPYPERRDAVLSWLDETGERAASVLLRRNRSSLEGAERVARDVESLRSWAEGLTDPGLREEAAALRAPLTLHGFRDDLVARAFALVREAARRRLGQSHFHVQLVGGHCLLSGLVAEMETGEGKTLTATLAASTAALAGLPVHVITVNDYLVARDAEAMGAVYEALGLSVGAVRQGMRPPERRLEYARDITYCSNKEIAFDYLRDRLALGRVRTRVRLALEQLAHERSRAERLVLRGLVFGIVDEADSVLVDEARTPLIISAGAEIDELEEQLYETAIALARELEPDADFILEPRSRRARLTESGEARLETLAVDLGGMWRGPRRRAELATQALGALHGYERDVHYLVVEGKVRIVDEFTGRVMPDRTWQRGLHQMIEAKEECEITSHTEPLARISYQRFFRRYLRLAGMTGTASEVAGELWAVYRLPVARIPTNRPVCRADWGSRVYATAEAKWRVVVERIRELHQVGRPVLVGTRSVAASEHLAALLEAAGLEHRVLNARQDLEEAEIVTQAGFPGRITVATNMAGRGTDIRLEPEVQRAGGLHVIATERHESHRIDRQLFGRCGRQGDPGSFEAIVSLEDELFQSQARRLAPLAGGSREGEDEEAAAGSRRRGFAMRAAQWRAERLNARARRSLLKIDERVDTMLAFSGKGE